MIFLLCLFHQVLFATGDSLSFDKNRIADTVVCTANHEYSYALYLPEDFSAMTCWPVIYIFDPAARGSVALQNFLSAAGKYGYILVASNNSRNGISWDKVMEIADCTMGDAEKRFSIDPGRMYTSGFSGGSRVASFIALKRNIAGVIGCGAGFPGLINNPGERLSFVYIGLVGNRDMNYQEMFTLEQELKNHGVKVTIRTSDFGHQWPSAEMILSAVEWLELQYAGKESLPEYTSFIREQFSGSVSRAQGFLRQGDILEAARNYRYILEDFPDQPETALVRNRLDSIEETRAYQKAEHKRDLTREEELNSQKELMYSLQMMNAAPLLNDSIQQWWSTKIIILKNMGKSKNRNKSMMASRLLNFLTTEFYLLGEDYVSINQFRKAVFLYELWVLAAPGNRYAYYYLAKGNALTGRPWIAFKALEKAAEYGFQNWSWIENDPVFSEVIQEDNFHALRSGKTVQARSR